MVNRNLIRFFLACSLTLFAQRVPAPHLPCYLDRLEETETRCSYLFDHYPSTHALPPAIHWLMSISSYDDTLELDDGSIWKISRYDEYKLFSWRENDPVVITQNHRWFSNYQYRIVNQATGGVLETNLFLGPIENGERTLYIHSIDYYQGVVVLANALHETSYWEISSLDFDTLQDWHSNDPVILGQNSGWDSDKEHLLINVATNNSIRVRLF